MHAEAAQKQVFVGKHAMHLVPVMSAIMTSTRSDCAFRHLECRRNRTIGENRFPKSSSFLLPCAVLVPMTSYLMRKKRQMEQRTKGKAFVAVSKDLNPLVAENLGLITPTVEDLRRRSVMMSLGDKFTLCWNCLPIASQISAKRPKQP